MQWSKICALSNETNSTKNWKQWTQQHQHFWQKSEKSISPEAEDWFGQKIVQKSCAGLVAMPVPKNASKFIKLKITGWLILWFSKQLNNWLISERGEHRSL